jgi:hypothetical protein
MQVHTQEVATDDVVIQAREILLQIGYTLAVNLYNLEWAGLLYQILSHYSHSGTNLKHRYVRTSIHRVGDALSYIQISQEVLTEIFLRSNLFHGGKDTKI